MTFSRPSTQNNVAGYINYKGEIPSSPQNYIDNSIPNCLDKTNGDTITGSIILAPGSSINMQADAIFVSVGVQIVLPGGTFLADAASVVTIDSVLNLGNGILFSATDTNPTITQTAPSVLSGGQNMIISAQNANSFGNGGAMIIQAGAGGGTGGGGELLLEAGNGASTGDGGNAIINVGTGNAGFSNGTFTVGVNGSSAYMMLLGAGGIQSFASTISTSGGTSNLTALQVQYMFIQVSGTLGSIATLKFPSVGPALWFVTFSGLNFNGHSVAFQSVNNLSLVNVGAAGSGTDSFAIVSLDSNNNIAVIQS